jgi:hypothetical protein
MRQDIGSSYTLAVGRAAVDTAASTVYSASVDHALGQTAYFAVDVGVVGSSGTLDVTLQTSADNSTWADDTALVGNTVPAQITATGVASVNVGNPLARYSRVKCVVAVANVLFGVTSLVGPLRSNPATDA